MKKFIENIGYLYTDNTGFSYLKTDKLSKWEDVSIWCNFKNEIPPYQLKTIVFLVECFQKIDDISKQLLRVHFEREIDDFYFQFNLQSIDIRDHLWPSMILKYQTPKNINYFIELESNLTVKNCGFLE